MHKGLLKTPKTVIVGGGYDPPAVLPTALCVSPMTEAFSPWDAMSTAKVSAKKAALPSVPLCGSSWDNDFLRYVTWQSSSAKRAGKSHQFFKK